MNFEEKFREHNARFRKNTWFTFDGLLGAALAAIVAPVDSRWLTFGAVAITHQIIHNQIDQCADDNFLKEIDRSLPFPLDGAFGVGASYLTGGWRSAIAFGAVHGPLHGIIEPEKK